VPELEALDEVEVLARAEIPEDERVLFVAGRRGRELAVEADEHTVVQVRRERRRREDDPGRPFALRPVGPVRVARIRARRARQGPECDEWLYAAAADALAGVVINVIVREAEVRRDAAQIRGRDAVQ